MKTLNEMQLARKFSNNKRIVSRDYGVVSIFAWKAFSYFFMSMHHFNQDKFHGNLWKSMKIVSLKRSPGEEFLSDERTA